MIVLMYLLSVRSNMKFMNYGLQSICQSFKKLLREFKIENLSKQFRFEVLLIVENWRTSYAKWLNSKLGLKANMTSSVLENSILNDKINLLITSMPNKEQLNESFCKYSFHII